MCLDTTQGTSEVLRLEARVLIVMSPHWPVSIRNWALALGNVQKQGEKKGEQHPVSPQKIKLKSFGTFSSAEKYRKHSRGGFDKKITLALDIYFY